jgi:hypothetical protein
MYKNIVYTGIFGKVKGLLIADWGKTMYVRLGERNYEVDASQVQIVK